MQPQIYTIGHSKHSLDYFLELLKHFSVTLVVDVRSVAASRFNPQFNKKTLELSLAKTDIAYRHLPEAFGARQTEPAYLDENGQVNFERCCNSPAFLIGIDLLEELSVSYTLALMCAEADPLTCHRFGMIAPALKTKGLQVKHILNDKTCLTQLELEELLLMKYAHKLPVMDLFTTKDERLAMAYRLLNDAIGYKAL